MAKSSSQTADAVPSILLRDPNDQFGRYLRLSAGAHALLAILLIVGGVVFDKPAVRYQPSLRVDLVALPDVKKSDLTKFTPSDELTQISKKLSTSKAAEAEPDNSMALKKEKPNAKKKSLQSAIDRIKALADIENEVTNKKSSATRPTVSAKGNVLSKGNSLTGGPGTDTNAYVGRMQSKLADNWHLPVWLSKQDLSAIVRVRLDRQGYIAGMVVEKSSGNKQFDDYAEKTIRMSQPFGPPPEDVLDGGVRLGFPL